MLVEAARNTNFYFSGKVGTLQNADPLHPSSPSVTAVTDLIACMHSWKQVHMKSVLFFNEIHFQTSTQRLNHSNKLPQWDITDRA